MHAAQFHALSLKPSLKTVCMALQDKFEKAPKDAAPAAENQMHRT